ncbi:putative oxidoreductase [Xylaria arbuscula]|nr:putative oxidoreductase [Xylaria arbuscula]
MAATATPVEALLKRSNSFDMTNEKDRRELLQAAKKTDKDRYEDILKRYNPSQQKLLHEFVHGHSLDHLAKEIPCTLPTNVAYQQSLDILDGARETTLTLTASAGKDEGKTIELPITNYKEGKKPVLTYLGATFSNWGKTVLNAPVYTCVPETVHGVQGIVKYAIDNDYGVRVAGYRHSWSSIFGRERSGGKQFILISTLKLERAVLGNEANVEATGKYHDWKVELNKIEKKKDLSNGGCLVSVGCATTNEDFRKWCIDNNKYTLPLNVIMVEITFGGSNAPICHGAGYKTKTLSDLVEQIEYVDAKAKVQTITSDDSDFLSAASGCFGLLGVVTRLTLRLDKMTIARMVPMKLPVVEAIPPPADIVKQLPPKLKMSYDGYKPEQIQKFVEEFERRAFKDYYAEWFWFPLHDQMWVNTWSLAGPEAKATDYPSQDEIKRQIQESFVLEYVQESLRENRKTTPEEGTLLISADNALANMAMNSLPPNSSSGTNSVINTQLPNALHFRRGIQNARVRDIEVEIPIPTADSLDIVRKAWWQAILLVYDNKSTCPMRMPLEMRIMGDSDVLMAPQRGNKHGTCAIEVLTPLFMENEWESFAQKMLDRWMSLRTYSTPKLNIRPHWAKEWQRYTVDGKPWIQYLKETSYKDEIPKFKNILVQIGQKQGWTLGDIQKLFSNELLDTLFFGS